MTRSHRLLAPQYALRVIRYATLHERYAVVAAFGRSRTLEDMVATLVMSTEETTRYGSLILTLPRSAEPFSNDDLLAMIARGTSCRGIESILAVVHGPPIENTRPHAHVLVKFAASIRGPKRQSQTLNAFARTIARRLDGGHFTSDPPTSHGRRKTRRDRDNSLGFDEWLLDVHHLDKMVEQARSIDDINRLLQAYHLDYRTTDKGALVGTRSSRPVFIKASRLHLSPNRLMNLYRCLPTNLPTRYLFDYERDKREKYSPEIVRAWEAAHAAWNAQHGTENKADRDAIQRNYLPRYRELARRKRFEKKALGAVAIETEIIHRALLLDHHFAEQRRTLNYPPKPHAQIGTWLQQVSTSEAPIGSSEGVLESTTHTANPWLPTAHLGAIKAWYDDHRRVATLDGDGRLTILAARLAEHRWSDLAITLTRPIALHPDLKPEERKELASLGTATTMQPVAMSDALRRMLHQPYHFDTTIQRTLLRVNNFSWITSTTNPNQIRELHWESRHTPAPPTAGLTMPLLHQPRTITDASALSTNQAPANSRTNKLLSEPPKAPVQPVPEPPKPASRPPTFASAADAWEYIDSIRPSTRLSQDDTPLSQRDPNRVTDAEIYRFLTPHPIGDLTAAPPDALSPHARLKIQRLVEYFDADSTITKNIIVFFPPDPTPYRYAMRWNDDAGAVTTMPLPLYDDRLADTSDTWRNRLDKYFDDLRRNGEIIPAPLAQNIATHYGITQRMIPTIPIASEHEAELYTIVATGSAFDDEPHIDPEIADYCRLHGYTIGIDIDDPSPEQPTREPSKTRRGRTFLRRR